MKLFAFEGAESEWVAADTEADARAFLRRHYGISDEDIALSYESVTEVDPEEAVFETDEVDAETEETITTTAAEIMDGKTKPFVVCSTAWSS